MRRGSLAFGFVLIVSTSRLGAQAITQTQVQAAAAAARLCLQGAEEVLDEKEGDKVKENGQDFKALGFGGGYGVVMNVSGNPRIESAQIVDRIVRVDKDNDVQFGPILEMHKFFSIRPKTLVKVDDRYALGRDLPSVCTSASADAEKHTIPRVGVGPFVSLRVGGAEVVQSFGIGLMLGFRPTESDKSLNIGMALTTDPVVRTLGDGLSKNSPLPGEETEIRYKTTHQEGLMVLFSVGW